MSSHPTWDGRPNFTLRHRMAVPFDGGVIVADRDFYLVIYTNHTSTDQVAGFGGGVKRSIGRKIMSGELKKMFDKVRAAVTAP